MKILVAGVLALALAGPAAGGSAAAESPACPTPDTNRSALATALDVLDLATYRVHTVYRRPGGGEITRTVPALVAVPALVNVDGGLLPDVSVTLLPTSTSHAILRVDRLPTAPRDLPLLVQARLDIPGEGAGSEVRFGYDTREGAQEGSSGEAPRSFRTTVDFAFGRKLDVPGSSSSLHPVVTLDDPGDRLDVVAEVFGKGPNGARIEPKTVRAALVPPPPELELAVDTTCRIAVETTDVRLDSAAPTKVTLDAGDERTLEGAVLRRDLHGEVSQLRDSIAAHRVHDLAAATDDLDVTPSHDIAHAELRLDERHKATPDVLDSQLLAKVDGVPAAGFTLDQESTRVELNTKGGAISRLEGGRATGRPVQLVTNAEEPFGDEPPPVEPGYGATDGDDVSFRVHGLTHAAVDTDDAGALRLEARSERRPFVVLQNAGTRSVTATLRNLPSDIVLRAVKKPFRLEYEAKESIDRIEASAFDPFGLTKRAQVARVRADGVPPCLQVSEKAQGGFLASTQAGVEDADVGECGAPLGTIDANLSSGFELIEPAPDNAIGEGADGVSLEDHGNRFVLHALVNDLREVELATPDPEIAEKLERRSFTARLDRVDDPGRRFEVHTDGEDPRRNIERNVYMDATLAEIPGKAAVTLDTYRSGKDGLDECEIEPVPVDRCDGGVEVRYTGGRAIDPPGEAPALLLDTNAGDRELAGEQVRYEEFKPNLRLDVPRLPARVNACMASDGDCVDRGPATSEDLSLEFDASEPIHLKMFDCRDRGADDKCIPEERSAGDDQVGMVADIEQLEFLQVKLEKPLVPGENVAPGHVFVNTSRAAPGVSDGTLVDGDGNEDMDGDGDSANGDLFMYSRSAFPGCPVKVKRALANLRSVRADHRLVEFTMGALSDCKPSGFDVESMTGRMTCGPLTKIDMAVGIFFIGDVNNDICGTGTSEEED